MFLIGGKIDFIKIIEWCNANNGFLTALLAFLSLLISTLAIVISIMTARLPYKKAIALNIYIPKYRYKLNDGSWSNWAPFSIDVKATNTGNRPVMLTFVGLGIKSKNCTMKRLDYLKPLWKKDKVLSPYTVCSVEYRVPIALEMLSKIDENKTVYVCAIDSEGKTHLKRAGKAKQLIDKLKDNTINTSKKV